MTEELNAVENTAQDASVNAAENVASVEPKENERLLSIKKEGLKNALKDIETLLYDINNVTGKVKGNYFYDKPVKIDIVASDVVGRRYLVTDLRVSEASYMDLHFNTGGIEGKIKKVYPCIDAVYYHFTDSPKVGDTIILKEDAGTYYFNRALKIYDIYGLLDVILDEWEYVHHDVFYKVMNEGKIFKTEEEISEQMSQINEKCLAIWSKHREPPFAKYYYRK